MPATVKGIAWRRLGRVGLFLLTFAAAYSSNAGDTGTSADRTFAWAVQNVIFFDAARFANSPVKEMLETSLVAELEKRNLRFVSNIESADLALSYIAALENEATPEEIVTFRASHPDIAALDMGPAKFEHGMVFVKLVDRGTGEKVWQSTQRRLVAPDMPEEERKQRLHKIIRDLLSTYPG